MSRRPRRKYVPSVDRLDDRWLPAASVSGLTPSQLIQAYGFGASSSAGAGQTIAIVDAFHDPNLASDLATFDLTTGLSGTTTSQVGTFLTQVDQAGNRTDDGWSGEEAMDVEWVHAIAPGAHIVVVEAASDSVTDLRAAVDTARSIPGVSVVSMSWGGGEFAGETALDAHFTTPAGHTPITFLAATGDSGSRGGAEWPASSPNVVAVGGTSLTIDSSGNPVSESAWSGSGGGLSAFESEPSYQQGVQSTGSRSTPDVSILGDPNTGVAIYDTTPSTGQGAWQVAAGTSLSTQIWAGLIADADQARAAAGESTLDTTTTLTKLYGSTGAFNDISSRSGGNSATAGYDLVTGLGSPRVGSVIDVLVGSGSTSQVTTGTSATPTSGTTTTTTPPTSTTPPTTTPPTTTTTTTTTPPRTTTTTTTTIPTTPAPAPNPTSTTHGTTTKTHGTITKTHGTLTKTHGTSRATHIPILRSTSTHATTRSLRNRVVRIALSVAAGSGGPDLPGGKPSTSLSGAQGGSVRDFGSIPVSLGRD